MKKRSLFVLTAAALGVVFLFAVVYATQQAADTMTMNSGVYETHTKGLATFNHKKHNVDYKIPCNECHHVYKDGKNVWKEGDEVQKCEACHKEASLPKGETCSKEEKIKRFHKDALHANCKGCHKTIEDPEKKKALTTCTACHPKPAAPAAK
jgi:hypothetical protein